MQQSGFAENTNAKSSDSALISKYQKKHKTQNNHVSEFGEISDKNVISLLKKNTPTFCDRLFLFSLTCIRYTTVPFSTFN